MSDTPLAPERIWVHSKPFVQGKDTASCNLVQVEDTDWVYVAQHIYDAQAQEIEQLKKELKESINKQAW